MSLVNSLEGTFMTPGAVAYVYDGDTFMGFFDIMPQGNAEVVTVRYKDGTASASTNGLKAELVARVLLGEMVRDDLGNRRTTASLQRQTAA